MSGSARTISGLSFFLSHAVYAPSSLFPIFQRVMCGSPGTISGFSFFLSLLAPFSTYYLPYCSGPWLAIYSTFSAQSPVFSIQRALCGSLFWVCLSLSPLVSLFISPSQPTSPQRRCLESLEMAVSFHQEEDHDDVAVYLYCNSI
jgi:hypothetical protein